ncbi:dTDP-4-dehydrorhamnose reductase family protein [Paenibacillus hexagrammi]|uniref:dTDP-4-dehydrorhamnose reductase n=1 Tax=Paenibacillus hexagrammi TaxID=2908839 RepID=A0ABY3SPC3_9BACL|nr:SDR family oxidoreductase [Paenibacillus sp. YPD9-1]UJF35793.1 SDR family oxidoreductase [Paenibacillus sp. YPD9-1]
MKILILGSRGMAGHMISAYLSANTDWEIWDSARGIPAHGRFVTMDFTNTEALKSALDRIRPHVVINAAGILNEQASRKRTESIYVNSLLPHLLTDMASIYGFRLLHISTDCVFSGKKGDYSETDTADGLTDYAKTKSLGEVITGPHLTVRTSIIGPELKEDGIGLFHWFMRQTGIIQGYTRVYWNGVTTLELAKAIHWCLLHPIEGLLHLSVPEKVSKYELLLLMQEHFHQDRVTIEPYDGIHSDKSLNATREDFAYQTAAYPQMMEELHAWMSNHPTLYAY